MENNSEKIEPDTENELLDNEALNQVNGGGTNQLELEMQMVVEPLSRLVESSSNTQKKKSDTQDNIIKNMK